MFAPLYSITPGMQVKVVNSYPAASLSVFVKVDNNVDCNYEIKKFISTQQWNYRLKNYYTFPTDGNPIKATRASPDFKTSNPSPFSPFLAGSNNCDRYFANFAFNRPKWYSVAIRSKISICNKLCKLIFMCVNCAKYITPHLTYQNHNIEMS